MSRASSERALGRVSVPVPLEVRRDAPRHPELVGLEPGASAARVYQELLRLGWQAARHAARERRLIQVYQDYERDPERQAVAAAMQRVVLEDRVV